MFFFVRAARRVFYRALLRTEDVLLTGIVLCCFNDKISGLHCYLRLCCLEVPLFALIISISIQHWFQCSIFLFNGSGIVLIFFGRTRSTATSFRGEGGRGVWRYFLLYTKQCFPWWIHRFGHVNVHIYRADFLIDILIVDLLFVQ